MSRSNVEDLQARMDARVAAEEPLPISLVLSAEAFLALRLPPREPIIEGFLYKQSLVELVGWRGTGKTWFGLAMAKAIAEGSPFLSWKVPTVRRVLYTDGEMAGRELQDRMRAMFGVNVPKNFELMASEIFYKATDTSLAINDPDQQKKFEGLLTALRLAGRDPEVLFFDNLSALTVDIEENSSTEFAPLKKWFTRLRHMGYTVLFVHHSGKSGEQRGTSGREDNLDMTLELTPPAEIGRVTRMTLTVDKCRGLRPTPDKVDIALIVDAQNILQLAVDTSIRREPSEDEFDTRYQILKHIALNDDTTAQKLMAEFTVSKSALYRYIAKLRSERLLSTSTGPLRVTRSGGSKVDQLWPGARPL